ncbi:MAG: hypothetical protein BM485_15390 [Desulfobulbaceae bacterium DB1]|nr:MAG: hypothetical protein BM485_15390 [Desulfobulbaceae bacterium DB1]
MNKKSPKQLAATQKNGACPHSETKNLHHRDLEAGFGEVSIPEALAGKYPNAARETGRQWVFPARERFVDPRSGKESVIMARDIQRLQSPLDRL